MFIVRLLFRYKFVCTAVLWEKFRRSLRDYIVIILFCVCVLHIVYVYYVRRSLSAGRAVILSNDTAEKEMMGTVVFPGRIYVYRTDLEAATGFRSKRLRRRVWSARVSKTRQNFPDIQKTVVERVAYNTNNDGHFDFRRCYIYAKINRCSIAQNCSVIVYIYVHTFTMVILSAQTPSETHIIRPCILV